MNDLAQRLSQRIDRSRLQESLFQMVSVPSPTGNAGAMAEHFAQALRGIGLPAELRAVPGLPNSPSVVARRPGAGAGPTLQFAGHLDTIHTPHAAPAISEGRIYGRGAADMKSGLAAIVEVLYVLAEDGIPLPGDVLVTAYDMHEHPWGHGEGVCELIDAGIFGAAALVMEGPQNELAIAGKGTASFEITLHSPGGSPHELHVPVGTTNPFHAAVELGRRLVAFEQTLRTQPIELLGTETLFLSTIHGGDFYNRLPGAMVLGGTRRFAPGRGFEAIRLELQEIADALVAGTELRATVTLGPIKEGFRQPADAKVIQATRLAHRALHGVELPLAGQYFGADNEFFINRAGISAVCMGAGLEQSHADVEYVAMDGVFDLARKLLLTTLHYFDLA